MWCAGVDELFDLKEVKDQRLLGKKMEQEQEEDRVRAAPLPCKAAPGRVQATCH